MTKGGGMANPPRPLTPHASIRHFFGAELRRLREQAGLSAAQLGEKVHYSGDHVAKIEKAERWPKLELAQALDQALATDGTLARLFPLLETERRQRSEEVEARVNRRELLRHGSTLAASVVAPFPFHSCNQNKLPYPALTAAFQHALVVSAGPAVEADGPGKEPQLRRLAGQVADAWSARQASRYQALSTMLPQLLADGHWAMSQLEDDERQQAACLLALSYQCTAGALAKIGEAHLAWIAAERALTACRDCDDWATIASSTRMLAHAVLALNRYQEAERLARLAAEMLEPRLAHGDERLLSVYGGSLLTGAVVAAKQKKSQTARYYLLEADTAAARLGEGHNHLWTAFGPTNAAIHRVSVEVELGEGGRAVECASAVNIEAIPFLERRAHHFIDVAAGSLEWGRDREALELLLEAAAIAPEEVCYQPGSRQIVQRLAERNVVSPYELTSRLRAAGAAP
jgi:transcriptional regulator with XRE-family HTH domain